MRSVFNQGRLFVRFLFISLFFIQSVNAGWLNWKFKIPSKRDNFVQLGEALPLELDPDNIKFMVWNIYKAKEKNFARDFKAHGQDVDVFMIQEAALNGKMEAVLAEFPDYQFDMGISFVLRKRGPDEATGSLVGSWVTPEEKGVMISRDREPIIGTPKAVTYAKYPLQGRNQELLVVNIHSLNMTSTRKFKRQLNDCRDLIAKHDGPVVFAGDFNTRNKRRLKYMYKIMKGLGLYEVKFTPDTRRRSKFSKIFIDFSFVRGMEVKSSEVLGDLDSSDHYAMLFSVKIP
ncbi:MAG: endonuclease/exonuclease/phosphatase family protein [Oligoflexia bacterium]|nr:endonuclease/exonuclease/phosphatase family protein [Oligoflexia bacterium]